MKGGNQVEAALRRAYRLLRGIKLSTRAGALRGVGRRLQLVVGEQREAGEVNRPGLGGETQAMYWKTRQLDVGQVRELLPVKVSGRGTVTLSVVGSCLEMA